MSQRESAASSPMTSDTLESNVVRGPFVLKRSRTIRSFGRSSDYADQENIQPSHGLLHNFRRQVVITMKVETGVLRHPPP